MTHLAAFVESRARNRQTVQLALLYPALLGVVSLGIITLLMVFVVPDIVKVFRDRGADLPLLTRALIGISAAVRVGGVYVLAGLVVASLAFARWSRNPRNRLRIDRMLAKNRLTRRLVQRMNAAQFAGTLATLLLSRVPLAEALVAAADVTPNRYHPRKGDRGDGKGPPGHVAAPRDDRGTGLPPDDGGHGGEW